MRPAFAILIVLALVSVSQACNVSTVFVDSRTYVAIPAVSVEPQVVVLYRNTAAVKVPRQQVFLTPQIKIQSRPARVQRVEVDGRSFRPVRITNFLKGL